jgi:hypothetical protein
MNQSCFTRLLITASVIASIGIHSKSISSPGELHILKLPLWSANVYYPKGALFGSARQIVRSDSTGRIYKFWSNEILMTEDSGRTWTKIDEPLESVKPYHWGYVTGVIDGHIIFSSEFPDASRTWKQREGSGIWETINAPIAGVGLMDVIRGRVLHFGMNYSGDLGVSWHGFGGSIPAVHTTLQTASFHDNLLSIYGAEGLFESRDVGVTWYGPILQTRRVGWYAVIDDSTRLIPTRNEGLQRVTIHADGRYEREMVSDSLRPTNGGAISWDKVGRFEMLANGMLIAFHRDRVRWHVSFDTAKSWRGVMADTVYSRDEGVNHLKNHDVLSTGDLLLSSHGRIGLLRVGADTTEIRALLPAQNLHSVLPVSDSVWIALLVNTGLCRTTDAGATWEVSGQLTDVRIGFSRPIGSPTTWGFEQIGAVEIMHADEDVVEMSTNNELIIRHHLAEDRTEVVRFGAARSIGSGAMVGTERPNEAKTRAVSTDGWRTSRDLHLTFPRRFPLQDHKCYAHPDDSTWFVQVNEVGLLRSTDDGRTWDTLGSAGALHANAPRHTVRSMHRVADGTLLAALQGYRTQDSDTIMRGGGLWYSTDNGTSWQRSAWPSTSNDLWIRDVVVDTIGNVTYVSTSSAQAVPPAEPFIQDTTFYFERTTWLRSDDAGRSFTVIRSELPSSNGSMFCAADGSIITYSPVESAVIRSSDRGQTWTPLHAPLPGTVEVTDIASTATGRLVIGTVRNGIFRTDPGVVSSVDVEYTVPYFTMQALPNPATTSVNVRLHHPSLTKRTFRSCALYDLTGIVVADLTADVAASIDAHVTDVAVDLGDVPTGMYILRYEAGTWSQTINVAVVR